MSVQQAEALQLGLQGLFLLRSQGQQGQTGIAARQTENHLNKLV